MSGQKHILVYIARHGTTDLNKAGAFRGPIDAPLDTSGFNDANKLSVLFSPLELSAIFHSDKKRSRATAEIIGRGREISIYPNPDLSAWNVGDLGGKPKNEENLAIVEHHVKNPDLPLPGGESLNEFKSRIRPLIADAIDMGLNHGVPPLIVSHSSVIHEIGSMISGDTKHCLVEPGGVCAIYIQDGKLEAEPIFKPRSPETNKPDLVT